MRKQSTVISYLIIIADDIGALQFECLFLVPRNAQSLHQTHKYTHQGGHAFHISLSFIIIENK